MQLRCQRRSLLSPGSWGRHPRRQWNLRGPPLGPSYELHLRDGRLRLLGIDRPQLLVQRDGLVPIARLDRVGGGIPARVLLRRLLSLYRSRTDRSRHSRLAGDPEQFFDVLAHLRFGQGALEQGQHLPLDHGDDRGDRLHLEGCGNLLLCIHINLGQDPAPGVLHCQFLEDRAQLFARPTPGGPQVHDNRDGLRCGDDLRFERCLGDVDDHSRCVRIGLAGRGLRLRVTRGSQR